MLVYMEYNWHGSVYIVLGLDICPAVHENFDGFKATYLSSPFKCGGLTLPGTETEDKDR